MKKGIKIMILMMAVIAIMLWVNSFCIGRVIDEHHGVQVHYNGWRIARSHGKHYHADGYYLGHKWQCVEFVKRYYYLHLNHPMPDGWGHAKDFYDTKLKDGGFNQRRGLYQYKNGGKTAPKADDLLVFNKGTYGHVAIVTEVGSDYIEIIQQNVFLKTRKWLPLQGTAIGGDNPPAGWLRKE